MISNMYPSEKDKTYGTFVKMFKEGIEHNMNDIVFDCCFIINKIEYCRNNCGDSPADRPRKPYSDFRIKCV